METKSVNSLQMKHYVRITSRARIVSMELKWNLLIVKQSLLSSEEMLEQTRMQSKGTSSVLSVFSQEKTTVTDSLRSSEPLETMKFQASKALTKI